VNQILLCAEVPLGRLNRGMAEEQLDLLKLPAGSATQLGAGAAEVVRRDAGNACGLSVPLEKLPHHLLAHSITMHLVAPADPTQDRAIGEPGRCRPGVDGDLDPRRHRDRAHPPVLADKVHDAPTVVPLLDVLERERGDLGPAQPAAKEDREHRAVAQPLLGGYVRRVQELLGLLTSVLPENDPHLLSKSDPGP